LLGQLVGPDKVLVHERDLIVLGRHLRFDRIDLAGDLRLLLAHQARLPIQRDKARVEEPYLALDCGASRRVAASTIGEQAADAQVVALVDLRLESGFFGQHLE